MVITLVLSICLPQSAEAWKVEPMETPSDSGMAPAWQREVSSGSAPVLQWLEQNPARLMVAGPKAGAWLAPRETARGEKWFLNWADVPASARDTAGRTLRTWLPISGGSAYDYSVRFQFEDSTRDLHTGGRLHEHDGPGEHGFVTLVPLPAGGFFALWLDGRAQAQSGQQLRGRAVRTDGSLGPELLLDDRCCDCCPTAAVALADGAVLVAWRDRTLDEIRDISFSRGFPEDPASWSAPQSIAPDGWRIPG